MIFPTIRCGTEERVELLERHGTVDAALGKRRVDPRQLLISAAQFVVHLSPPSSRPLVVEEPWDPAAVELAQRGAAGEHHVDALVGARQQRQQ